MKKKKWWQQMREQRDGKNERKVTVKKNKLMEMKTKWFLKVGQVHQRD